MRIFRACRCRHLPLPLPLPLGGRAYCGPQAATSLSSFSLMTCIAFFGCYCCCCYRNLLIIAINVFVIVFFIYCLLIPGDKVKSINLSRQPCMRFCFGFFLFLTCLQIGLASLCACFVCFLVADDDVVVVVVLACHFTFYAVAAAAYCLLRVYLRYVFL